MSWTTIRRLAFLRYSLFSVFLLPAICRAEALPNFSNNLGYSWKLFSELEKQPGNITISPFSIEEALGLCAFGAKGKTAQELNTFLEFEPETGDLRLAAMAKDMKSYSEKGELTFQMANGLFLQDGHQFNPNYLQGAKERYLAEIKNVDFKKRREESRTTINRWVSDVTEKKIPELLSPSAISSELRMVIVNAIYLKAEWEQPFRKALTQDKEFFPSDGISQKVPFLRNVSHFPYYETSDFQLLELPYKGEEVGLLIILPKTRFALKSLTAKLNPTELEKAFRGMTRKNVNVSLPKFSTSSSFHLANALQSLGVRSAFQGGSADFSPIDGTREIFIGDIIHKAIIELDEKGTVAAAATAVMAVGAGAPPPPEELVIFEANQPFLFAIREHRRGGILFLGRFESAN